MLETDQKRILINNKIIRINRIVKHKISMLEDTTLPEGNKGLVLNIIINIDKKNGDTKCNLNKRKIRCTKNILILI